MNTCIVTPSRCLVVVNNCLIFESGGTGGCNLGFFFLKRGGCGGVSIWHIRLTKQDEGRRQASYIESR